MYNVHETWVENEDWRLACGYFLNTWTILTIVNIELQEVWIASWCLEFLVPNSAGRSCESPKLHPELEVFEIRFLNTKITFGNIPNQINT